LLEHRTVFITQSGLLILLSGVILLVFRRRRQERGDGSAVWLSAAYLTSGLALALLALESATHPQFTTIVGNTLLLAFAGLTGRALTEATGQPAGRIWMAMLALDLATIAACSYLTYIAPERALLGWISGTVTGVMYGWLIVQVRRCRDEVIQPAVNTIAWLFALHIAVHTVRLIVWRFAGISLWFSGMNILTIGGVALSFLWMDGLRSREELERAAMTDPLTGLYNRRALHTLATEWKRSARAGEPLSALMVDVDHFKAINDSHGHSGGDLALCAIAGILKSVCVRSVRLGGDEFFAVLPAYDQAAAESAAARVRVAVSELVLQMPDGETCQVSVSIGCVTLMGADATIADLMHAGDVLLYAEKQRRRPAGYREGLPVHWHAQEPMKKAAPPSQ
jgi:diguanylate cyclase (GGDEF)-like protein